jgi:hypothetical protein
MTRGISADVRRPLRWARDEEASLARARRDVAALLADVELLRPGLARHRSLAMVPRWSPVGRTLRESFSSCEAIGVATRSEGHVDGHGGGGSNGTADGDHLLPFAAETFDLVHCGAPPREQREEWVITEAIRVLRLQGVAIVDCPLDERTLHESLRVRGISDPLPVQLSVLRGLPLRAGDLSEIPVAVTNTGGSVLGSAINPLRLAGRWSGGRDDGKEAGAASLPGIIEPGHSFAAALPVTVPGTAGSHVLELSLASPGPWGERCSPVTELTIEVAPARRGQLTASVALLADERASLTVARAHGLTLGTRIMRPPEVAQPLERHFLARR